MPIDACIRSAFAAYTTAPTDIRVEPAVPILYFGNLGEYLESKDLRIITVAVNPSHAEFPTSTPWTRFPNCSAFYPPRAMSAAELANYAHDLDRYFDTDPYWNEWFRQLEPVLKGFGASLKDDAARRAIHTDLMTPVPTDPTFGTKGAKPFRARLSGLGVPLWEDLVRELKPDIALASFNEDYLPHLNGFAVRRNWTLLHTHCKPWGKSGTYTYDVRWKSVEVCPGHTMDIVFAPQRMNTPFTPLSDSEKFLIGSVWAKNKLTHW